MSDKNDLKEDAQPERGKAGTIPDWRARLINHPIYRQLDAPEKIRLFMSRHVFAVWDFMSLLKRLQLDLTCVSLPWRPRLVPEQTKYARFINEIVLGEETDVDGAGGAISHFDLYLQAMGECGAEVLPVRRFLSALETSNNPESALAEAEAPAAVRDFVGHTLRTALHGKTHEVCATFFYGREDLIPDMFRVIVDELENKGQSAGRLLYYLKRHIELDGDEHGPLAGELLEFLCAGDQEKKDEAEKAAAAALKARIGLWDGILKEIKETEKARMAAS